MTKPKAVLTTGEVAKICKVAPRTVSKWFDTGQLRGYRIPGSRDRRIPLPQLVRFMKVHGIPLDGIETGLMRILIVDHEADLAGLVQRGLNDTGRYEARVAGSAFEAGVLVEQSRPHLLLVDVDVPGMEPGMLSMFLCSHPELSGTQLVAMSASLTEGDQRVYQQHKFAATIAKPFDLHQLTETIDEVLNLFS
ncbi:MAG TPA: response regulator [Phycisphaerae bacterium]|nr:response regulator [Phycisphaerae bacterium]HRY69551.1 response regulator [Phycisphaerae bacterium]